MQSHRVAPACLLSQCVADGGGQVTEVLLQHIIGSTTLDVLDRRLVAQAPGHYDQRDVLARVLENFQGILPCPVDQVMVSQDDVEVGFIEVLSEQCGRIDYFETRNNRTGMLQRGQNELGVGGTVFNNQQSQRPV